MIYNHKQIFSTGRAAQQYAKGNTIVCELSQNIGFWTAPVNDLSYMKEAGLSLCYFLQYSLCRITAALARNNVNDNQSSKRSQQTTTIFSYIGHSFEPMSGLKMQLLYNQIMQLIIVYSRVILHMNYILITSITCSISRSTLQRRNNSDGTKVYSNS